MAFNRQTRMLANLTLSDCYRIDSNMTRYQREETMLQSAKLNLARYFKFFGLLEYPDESQTLFEKTFEGLKFGKRIPIKKVPLGASFTMLSEYNWNRIVEKNSLDVRLFQFAKDLFLQRLKRAKIPIVYHQSEAKFVSEGFKYTLVGF